MSKTKIKVCVRCQNEFPDDSITKLRKYCDSCQPFRIDYWKRIKCLEKRAGNCNNCGKPLRSFGAKHCLACHNKLKSMPIGSDHPGWKGGKIKINGYVCIKTGIKNGITQYTREHRLIWEGHHKKKLPKGWLVHHLNGIKDDNRIENLVALPRNKHTVWTLVELAQKRIRELEQLHLPLF